MFCNYTESEMKSFELKVLGTNSALPTSTRYPTAQVLNIHERFFLIDCGEGTQIQFRKYKVKTSRINHIFISHLHGDHYFGLIGLLSTYSLLGRINDLHIYSHSELPKLIKPQLDHLMADMQYQIIWHPLNFKKPQVIIETEDFKVTSFPVKHRVSCCGFLFEEQPEAELNIKKKAIEKYQLSLTEINQIKKGSDFMLSENNVIPNTELTYPRPKTRSYAYSSDTAYFPEMCETIKNVDLLYHEATYDKTFERQAAKTTHSTAAQAATIASMANVSKLILGHFSARYKTLDVLLNEAKLVFPNTEIAEEGKTYKVEG